MNTLSGLSDSEAQTRLRQNGPNELPSAKPKSLLAIIVQVIQEPMFMLLITCGGLYIILGDYREGAILSSSILVIIAITFYQYRKTQRALEALRKLSSPRALVIRNGVEQRIAGRDVVPGDILVLQEGDRIAADATLLEVDSLLVDESLLTGESFPVDKSLAGTDASAEVFSGTLVLRGNGFARVTSTGTKTKMGRIGLSLHDNPSAPTRLQQEMKSTIRKLGLAGIGLSILVTLSYLVTRGNFMDALLNGLSAAMAILPEEFPVVLTIFLALGAWRLSQRKVLTRDPATIETLGSATVLCSDKTGTITENRMAVTAWCIHQKIHHAGDSMDPSAIRLATMAGIACPEKPVDPMDKAVLNFASGRQHSFRTVEFRPFSRSTMLITHIGELGGETVVAVKGAPEAILQLCPLTREDLTAWEHCMKEMAGAGLRVLGVAEGKYIGSIEENRIQYRFLGFIGLEDPIRPEVPAAVQECIQAGIRVVMITGDYPVTATSIASKIGLPDVKFLTGQELERMDDQELDQVIRSINLFARVVPEQKLRIVKALQNQGEVVAMTGDGINDAPALKAADIGVAMGLKGTDVAREASSLVLLDDHFASIVQGIRMGRRIYDNLIKAMMYIMAIHIPIIGLSLLPAFFPSLPILLFPLHIVFMELIIDPVCSVAFENEPGEPGLMQRKPRSTKEKFFGYRQISQAVFNGLTVLSVILFTYFISIEEGHSAAETRLIAFSGMILANIGFILSSLSRSRNVLQVLGERNPAVKIILGSALAVLAAITFIPFLRKLFAFELPAWHHLAPSILAGVAVVVIFETMKYFRNRRPSQFQPDNDRNPSAH